MNWLFKKLLYIDHLKKKNTTIRTQSGFKIYILKRIDLTKKKRIYWRKTANKQIGWPAKDWKFSLKST